jgi:PIN domain nuclease of toxin-antitoxin system
MILLADTHILLWAALQPDRIPLRGRQLLEAEDNQPLFSAASLWEISIKHARGRPDFTIDPRRLYRQLLANGWRELAVSVEHALAVLTLPPLHKDPFDRILVAQATVEGAKLLTVDRQLGEYGGPTLSL